MLKFSTDRVHASHDADRRREKGSLHFKKTLQTLNPKPRAVTGPSFKLLTQLKPTWLLVRGRSRAISRRQESALGILKGTLKGSFQGSCGLLSGLHYLGFPIKAPVSFHTINTGAKAWNGVL